MPLPIDDAAVARPGPMHRPIGEKTIKGIRLARDMTGGYRGVGTICRIPPASFPCKLIPLPGPRRPMKTNPRTRRPSFDHPFRVLPMLLFAAALFGTAGCVSRPVPDTAGLSSTNRLPVPATRRVSVAFQLSPDAEVVDFAGPWGVFEYVSLAGQDDTPFELYTVAETTAPLRGSGGMMIVPGCTFENAPQPRIIVVPAQS